MKTRKLGATGQNVSELSLGSMMFGWRVLSDEAFRMVDEAIDAGINLIDTSNSYGKGASEEIVGAALARDSKRKRVLIASKCHFWKEGDSDLYKNSVQQHIIQQCEESLRRLKVDVIDVYQIHRPSSLVPIEEVLSAFDVLIKQGKVRWGGTSTFAAWQLVEAQWRAKDLELIPFSCEQTPYNLLDRSIEREVLPMAQTFDLGVLAYAPLAEGALTGQYRRNQPLPKESRFARVTRPGAYRAQLTARVFEVIEKLEVIANEKEISTTCLALAWVLQNSSISTVIVGLSRSTQFQDLIKSMQVRFSSNDLERIDEICPPCGFVSRYFESDFGPHSFRRGND